jgi:hypothetical protein
MPPKHKATDSTQVRKKRLAEKEEGGKEQLRRSPEQIIDDLLSRDDDDDDDDGRRPPTFSASLGIDLRTRDGLFCLLIASLLFSARIAQHIAEKSIAIVISRTDRSAEKLRQSTWDERCEWLTEGGYTRYREKTSTALGDLVDLLDERYGEMGVEGLREEAGRNIDEERRLLKEFKGIGDTGADIFLREVQAVWDEVFPFADRRAIGKTSSLPLSVLLNNDKRSHADFSSSSGTAKKLGLADSPRGLLKECKGDKEKFLHLLTVLVRTK